jgi:hypothetical protein
MTGALSVYFITEIFSSKTFFQRAVSLNSTAAQAYMHAATGHDE